MSNPASSPQVYRFDDDARSVAVFDPNLPAPWINYLSNGSLHAFVSQAGGGSLWWKTPINFRLTRYRGWTTPTDAPGFYVYVREADGTVWSPSAKPCETPLDAWEARHSPGESRFIGRRGDVEVSLRLFIPSAEKAEDLAALTTAAQSESLIWDIEVTNHGSEPVALDLFGYVELGLLEYPLESSWGYYVRHQFKTWFDAASQSQLYLFHHESHPRLSDVPLVFFASDRAVVSYSGDRQHFLGYGRTERHPLGVERGHCGNDGLWGGDACAALQTPLTVAPGQTERVAYYLGVVPGAMVDFDGAKARLKTELARLRQPGYVAGQRAKLADWWRVHFAAFECRLPDADIERQVRTWTPVNCVQTGRYSRSFSQFASGLRGFGFRDTAQDMLAQTARQPAWARAEFLRLLRHQFADGHAVHTYYPEDNQPPATSVHSDDHIWLPMLAYALVAETGEAALLDERVPFLAKDGVSEEPPRQPGGGFPTVWDHLVAALEFTQTHLGGHDLPLTLHSDWNDCLGRFARKGKGETAMVAQQLVYVLGQMIELANLRGDTAAAGLFAERLETHRAALLRQCWDGEWWLRGFDDSGAPMGSRSCEAGQIWLNTQTWAVLAGVGSREQQVAAMDSVARILDTPCGIKKLHPSFPTFPESADAFSGYSLGAGENGAIFCHANTWAVIAEALLGRPERAWKYYRQLVPHVALQHAGLDRYQAEPYAYASSIIGPENPRFGLATLTHVTGTAAWMDVAATQYLLGIRPTLVGLKIAPCLPADWPGFQASRVWRGCRLEIEVAAKSDVPSGAPNAKTPQVAALILDGTRHEGDTLKAEWLAGKTAASVRVEWA